MSACPKCQQEAGCPCGWGTDASGEKVCPSCCAKSYAPQNVQQAPIQNNPVGIQPQNITYQHNYT